MLTLVDVLSGSLGTKARIGIDAQRDIPVHRKEVWDAIQRENKAVWPVDDVEDVE